MKRAEEMGLSERYRPKVLADLVGNAYVKSALIALTASGNIPHFLFFGPPGTGKTTAAKALAREAVAGRESNILELNASDERGIDVVREKIKAFSSAMGIGSALKIVILDEADSMTKDAQNALRRIIEMHAGHTRFVIICNYSTKIIPAIKSRCAPFRFTPIKAPEISAHIESVARNEVVVLEESAAAQIAALARGDLRRALNILEGLSTRKKITSESIREYHAQAGETNIKDFYEELWQSDFNPLKTALTSLKSTLGLSLKEIVHALAEHLKLSPKKEAPEIMQTLSEIEYRLARGCTEEIQENLLLATFTLRQ